MAAGLRRGQIYWVQTFGGPAAYCGFSPAIVVRYISRSCPL